MNDNDILTGVLLEEDALTLEQLARACAVEPHWIVQHVQAGILGCDSSLQIDAWRFTSGDLDRARRLAKLERDLGANEDVAALVVDLSDEVRRLKARLRVLGEV